LYIYNMLNDIIININNNYDFLIRHKKVKQITNWKGRILKKYLCGT
jgi:hypothetical protein